MALDPEVVYRLKCLKREIDETPFIVFVWGPGVASDTPQAQKRRQLRADLEEVLRVGRVLFSEDPELGKQREAGDFTAEYYHAKIADAVVLIPESPGSLTEAALYQGELLGKAVVFTTRREEAGFARTAYHLLKVYEIEPEEWRICDRVRRLAREFVESLRIYKFRTSVRRLDILWNLSHGESTP